MTGPIPLDVFADIACPWCMIGHRRLHAVLEGLPPDSFELRHRSYELQPQLPERGMPMREFVEKHFGSAAWANEIYGHIAAEGLRDGIPFDLVAMKVAPNTRLAHRAIALAREQDFEQQAVEALFLAHFAEGRDVTDFAVVVERLADAGLPDPPALAVRLAAGEGEEAVAEDETIAAQIGVRGVPLTVAARRAVLQGAQDATDYRAFLEQALAAG